MRVFSKTFVMAAAAAAVFSASSAMADPHEVVTDNDGDVVVNSFGNCVRTKWMADTDACGTATPPPAPKKVAAAPQATVREHQRSYLVFFDFDKATLSPEATGVLRDLYNKTKGSMSSQFHVVGHTDLAGSNAYNLGLSKRRADAVKQALMSMGASNISMEAKGESKPLVPTKDGIREAQNRRAEVKVKVKERR